MGFFSSTQSANGATQSNGVGTTATRRVREGQGSLSIIAKDLTVAGDLQAAGVVRIEGRVIGNVHAGEQVLLCDGGVVEGDLVTREAVLGGRVHGCVRATERVEVQASAMVHGDIQTERLLIHEGGRVNGVVSMEPVAVQGAEERTWPRAEGAGA